TTPENLLESELTCPVCLDIFRDPRLLPCGHNLCLLCVQELRKQRGNGQSFSCPECREDPAAVFCDCCLQKTAAVRLCLKCEVALCGDHVRLHTERPAFRDHTLTELGQDPAKRKCPEHGEVFRFYCVQDEAALCSSCTVQRQHKGHDMKTYKELAEEFKFSLILSHTSITSLARYLRSYERQVVVNTGIVSLSSNLLCRMGDLLEQVGVQTGSLEDLLQRVNGKLSENQKLLTEQERNEKMITVKSLCADLWDMHLDMFLSGGTFVILLQISDPLSFIEFLYGLSFYKPLTKTICFTDISLQERQVSSCFSLYYYTNSELKSVSFREDPRQTLHCNLQQINVAPFLFQIKSGLKCILVSSTIRVAVGETGRSSRNRGKVTVDLEVALIGYVVLVAAVETPIVLVKGTDVTVMELKNMSLTRQQFCMLSAWHDNRETALPVTLTHSRVALSLDYGAGTVSLHDVGDTLTHLHTFSTTFTQPVCLGFAVFSGQGVSSISIVKM
uniref:Uncharacterized protein n=1 Tax=Lepisosteus oculatus TaxID=7918 RepID=W5M1Y5_LEPOC